MTILSPHCPKCGGGQYRYVLDNHFLQCDDCLHIMSKTEYANQAQTQNQGRKSPS